MVQLNINKSYILPVRIPVNKKRCISRMYIRKRINENIFPKPTIFRLKYKMRFYTLPFLFLLIVTVTVLHASPIKDLKTLPKRRDNSLFTAIQTIWKRCSDHESSTTSKRHEKNDHSGGKEIGKRAVSSRNLFSSIEDIQARGKVDKDKMGKHIIEKEDCFRQRVKVMINMVVYSLQKKKIMINKEVYFLQKRKIMIDKEVFFHQKIKMIQEKAVDQNLKNLIKN